MSRLDDNLARIRSRIADAAERSGRLAGFGDACRGHQIGRRASRRENWPWLAASIWAKAGRKSFGAKRPALSDLAIRWHLIGHLQRNKVERTLPLVSMIHSVDSLRLLRAIDAAAEALGRTMPVLLEVNISGDAAKHGFSPTEMPERLAEAAAVHARANPRTDGNGRPRRRCGSRPPRFSKSARDCAIGSAKLARRRRPQRTFDGHERRFRSRR